jgi:tetratricopeptide (TPR) repeat protein
MEYPNRLLTQFCRRRRIRYLDLTNRFAGEDNVADLYLTAIGDGHLSARGQALVADELSSLLKSAPLRFRTRAVEDYRMGQYFATRGNRAAAEEALLAADKLLPDWSAPPDALGDLYKDQRLLQEALEQYRQALDIDPGRRQTWAKLARLLDQMDGQEAAAAWGRALDLHPEWCPYYSALLSCYQAQGKADEAAKMKDLIKKTEQAPLPIKRYWWNEHVSQGIFAAASGRWTESAREFERAIHFLPDEPVAYYNLGWYISRPTGSIWPSRPTKRL